MPPVLAGITPPAVTAGPKQGPATAPGRGPIDCPQVWLGCLAQQGSLWAALQMGVQVGSVGGRRSVLTYVDDKVRPG
jgi:hypothetical protein